MTNHLINLEKSSIPDNIMLEYYQYLTHMKSDEFEGLKTSIDSGEFHPNEAKKQLLESRCFSWRRCGRADA